jgi:RNA polymerase sigma-70 factor (ECF subfamily)
MTTNEDEFLRLYQQHEGSLRAILRVMLANWHEVDDVVQETCLTALQRFDSFRPGTNFCAWIIAIGRFEALRYRRCRATRRMVLADDVVQLIEAEVVSRDARLSGRRDVLEQCLDRLPETSRSLLQAVYANQVSINDLAQKTNRSVDAIYKQLQRIRHRLFECVERRLAREELNGKWNE